MTAISWSGSPIAAARAGLLGQPLSKTHLQPFVPTSVATAVVVSTLPVSKPTAQSPQPVARRWLTQLQKTVLTVIAILGLTVALAMAVPSIWYFFSPPEVIPVTTNQVGSAFGGSFAAGTTQDQPQTETKPSYQPPVDATLPRGQWLVIPRIGVRTELKATANAEEALNTGVWFVPGYGAPGDTELPMILAAHRYGWKWWWQSDYWRYHSFYYLPNLEPGDTVEIISNQQKWVYEIYAGEEGDEITDYNADLILYTCKFLNSPVRHFRYARLIDPTKDTQQPVGSVSQR